MRVEGVSWHSGRIDIKNPSLKDDETVELFMQSLRATITDSVRMVCQCHPTYLVMGMSAETFWGGKDGAAQFEKFMHEKSGLAVSTGARAAKAALDVYGAKKIAAITPYQPVGDQQVSDLSYHLEGQVLKIAGVRLLHSARLRSQDHRRSSVRLGDLDRRCST
jgi:maleate isomerase